MKGRCICNAIEYEVSGELKAVLNCHCNLCKQMNGAAVSTYAIAADEDFTLHSGELAAAQVSEYAAKSFCPHCATPIYNSNPRYPGLKIIHLGTLDDSQQLSPQFNIYCESRFDWLAGVNDLPSFQQAIVR